MLEEIFGCARKGENFAFETTLAGLGYLRHIEQWKREGYHVELFFLALPSAELALARVAERVRQGGHHVPEAVVRRRFHSGHRNFHLYYRDRVHSWVLYDNAGAEPILMEWGENQ